MLNRPSSLKTTHWLKELFDSIVILTLLGFIVLPLSMWTLFLPWVGALIPLVLFLVTGFLWAWQTYDKHIIFIIIPLLLFSLPLLASPYTLIFFPGLFFLCVLFSRKWVLRHNGLNAAAWRKLFPKTFAIGLILWISLAVLVPRFSHLLMPQHQKAKIKTPR